MIRSVGTLGPVKIAGIVAWRLRWDLLAIVVVAGVLLPVPDPTQIDYASAVLSVLGIGASVFIGFRNTTAYNRWWEARTLWGSVIINSRATHNTLCSVDSGAPGMVEILDRMRRRQARYCWQLAAELRGIAPIPEAADLTPEDPAGTSATNLLTRQAEDVQTLSATGSIDNQARVMLMNVNTALVGAQSGLERIRNEPIPIIYEIFIRGLAWFFAVMAFSRLDGSAHPVTGVVIGLLLMIVFITAERLGHFIEQPMSNTVFDISMYRFCATITGNLLGAGHRMAQPRESAKATVWM
ncbi:bestrophin family ion channel [Mycobacterium sp. CVI_P3]|uniref:Bestrophin family ion channel n=1 Tax=Mycobacterium pinniadriaticum TaxID=2994102 RepID=A0ABT3SD11_9MYCO|nr:bestrophin family ion channel [Mycobacterium pinniadriaticum]MCX2930955.1 bestrophin family ion channel [Mycobacterium pinniadriaticum]MCX2937379.1 bestrophin family ion channel [Mycobacterium pinniadriaticum]